MDHTLTLPVVIPAHNEEGNNAATVAALRQVLVREAIPYELVLVNDNSTDATADVLAGLAAEDPGVVVRREPPRGFGRAVREGLDNASGDVTVLSMADLSDDADDAAAYYRKIEKGYDFLQGLPVLRHPRHLAA